MKTMQSIIILLALASAQQASAEIKVGNGGDAVVCYTDPTRTTVQSVKMFDYWEQSQVLQYAGSLDLGATNLSVEAKINKAVDRAQAFDPELANNIRPIALALVQNIEAFLATSEQLPEIDDANPRVIPNLPNCFIEQFAIQYKDVTSGQRRFKIAAKFYNHASLTNDDKAGLLLHEAIYRYALLNGASNSDGVRLYNYTLATPYLESGEAKKYFTTLTNANIHAYACELVEKKNIPKWYGEDMYFRIEHPVKDPHQVNQQTCFNQIVFNKTNLQISVEQNSWADRSDEDDEAIERRGAIWKFETKSNEGVKIRSRSSISSAWIERATWTVMVFDNIHRTNEETANDPYYSMIRLSVPGESAFSIQTPFFEAPCVHDLNSPYETEVQFAENNPSGQMVTCSINNTNIQITGQSMTISRSVAVDKAGNFLSYNLNDGALVKFQNQFVAIKAGAIKIDPQGNLLSGELLNPIPVLIPGTTLYGRVVKIYNGKTEVEYTPELNNTSNKILVSKLANAHALNNCKQISNQFKYAFTADHEVNNYIAAPTSFYDADTKKVVVKTDEYVKYIDRYQCMGYFDIQL